MQIEVLRAIQSISSPILDKMFIYITMMGEEYFLIAVTVIVFWCVNKKLGYKLGFVVLTSSVINYVAKDVFHALLAAGRFGEDAKNFFNINRPIGQPEIRSLRTETATGWPFPSGHTQGTTAFWITFMLHLRKKWIYAAGTVCIILVGFSRLYLGVHWPSDVIGGLIIGGLWALFACWVFDKALEKSKKSILLFIIVPVISGMVFYFDSSYCQLAGTLTGFFAGYVVEDKYIKFTEKAKLWQQILKFVFGFIVLLLIRIIVKKLLPVSPVSDFIRYLLIGLWITAGAPEVFTRLLPGEPINKKMHEC